ncbi:hypothetical protein [Acinetobacter indicus]|uniref:hypothetical protein n=1 Tax=Acinetobacter indicus TaxID=756892 RepID=UPI001C082AC0|nr:hypothetical protein [Acinetobacter indicus]
MYTQRRQPVWFSYLMAFVMGWSSLVLAVVQPAHAAMQLSNSAAITSAKSSVSSPTPCHAEKADSPVEQHHPSHHSTSPSAQLPDCEQVHHPEQHLNCQDCPPLHCQPGLSYLKIALPVLEQASPTFEPEPHFHLYHAQHLPGYWQEILRPPKTLS